VSAGLFLCALQPKRRCALRFRLERKLNDGDSLPHAAPAFAKDCASTIGQVTRDQNMKKRT
jgi:hypothetical protein